MSACARQPYLGAHTLNRIWNLRAMEHLDVGPFTSTSPFRSSQVHAEIDRLASDTSMGMENLAMHADDDAVLMDQS